MLQNLTEPNYFDPNPTQNCVKFERACEVKKLKNPKARSEHEREYTNAHHFRERIEREVQKEATKLLRLLPQVTTMTHW